MTALPPDFVDLSSGYDQFDTPVNLIGVCIDHLPARKSGGTDFTIKFTLHDIGWYRGKGMVIRFFHKEEQNLPPIQNNGDVLIIRNIKTKNYRGDRIGMSNTATSWVVVDGIAVHESKCPQGSDITKFVKSPIAGSPSTAELVYAKKIAAEEDPSMYNARPSTTSLPKNPITSANQIMTQAPSRFSLIQDLIDRKFADLVGEVRRVYPNDSRVEIYVTDYTSHSKLFNYVDDGTDGTDGVDGDPYGYQTSSSRQWKGPWGRRTICICLWGAHAGYAARNKVEGQYVSLRNVQIKMDKSGQRLEGHCRGDRDFPDRVNVSLLKPREAEADGQFKQLLKRKRDYEKIARAQYRRVERTATDSKTEQSIVLEKGEQTRALAKTAKSQKRKEKREKRARQRQPALKADGDGNIETNDSPNRLSVLVSKASCNPQIRIKSIDVPSKTIDQILDPDILKRVTPKGVEFFQPFQNCRYKSKVKVIDFFPDNIADFAAPHQPSEYEMLSDHSSDSDSDIKSHCSGAEVIWEWRFLLLVEDATGPRKRRMEILVAGEDGDQLLNETACDLRQMPKQRKVIGEKLFLLWGNLAELKASANKTEAEVDMQLLSSLPFECFIKEYGISSKIVDGNTVETERMFRMFDTTIK